MQGKQKRKRKPKSESQADKVVDKLTATAKYPNSCKLNQAHIKKIIHRDQVGFISEIQKLFSIQKSVKAICHINTLKEKTHMIISLDMKKDF